MKISIITALFNKLELTQEFWTSLEAHPPSGEWEIIWIDDGSTDGTRQWLSTLPGPRHRVILNDRNLGYAASNNRGAQAATGEILALLNNDLVLTPGWHAPMQDALLHSPSVGVVGNVQLNALTGEVDHSGIYFDARGNPTHDRTLPVASTTIRPVFAATAACLLITKSCFDSFGGFEECFRNGGEDVDLCLRLHTAGRQNYIAIKSVVRHHVSSSPGRTLHNEQNSFLLIQRWYDLIPLIAVACWLDVTLRDRWESKLDGWQWHWARVTRRWRRRPQQACPTWMRRAVISFLDRKIHRWSLLYPGLQPPPASLTTVPPTA